MDKHKEMQDKSAQQIQEKVSDFRLLFTTLEKMLANAINLKISKDRGNAFTLKKQVNLLIQNFVKNIEYSRIGADELEYLHANRLKIYESNNIKRKKITKKQKNAFFNAEREVKNALALIENQIVLRYRELTEIYSTEYINTIDSLSETDDEDIFKIAEEDAKNRVISLFAKEGGNLSIKRENGSKINPQDWIKWILGTSYVINISNDGATDADDYGIDLLRTSAHTGCSDLCAPYQGKVYSRSGKSKKFPAFKPILMFEGEGGTYKHWNCRHHESDYIEGSSFNELYDEILDIPDEKRKQEYERRQKGNYYRRLADQWGDRARRLSDIGASSSDIKYAKQKQAHYNRLKRAYGVN